MNRIILPVAAIGLAVAVPAAASPGDMDVATFLAKAEKLKGMGMRAMFSSELKPLKAAAEDAGSVYRARLAADRKAGRSPHSCPPPKGKASIDADAMIAHLKTYPASRRGSTTMKTAFADLMAKRYPCR